MTANLENFWICKLLLNRRIGDNMKILLLGSLISAEQMEQLNNNSKEKASIAPVNYETMLAKGLVENGAEVEVLSVPAIAAYPHSIYKRIYAKHEVIENQIQVQWVPFINIQGLKQSTIKSNTEKLLKKWLKDNKAIKNKVVLMYSIYPPYSEPAIRLCKKYGCHISAVITDLPEYMYSWKNMKGIRGIYAKKLSQQMLDLQDACNSYVLFTKSMAARMKIENKPYIVSEGFSDVSIFNGISKVEKYEKKTIVYGGNLSKLYGIRNLVNGFMLTDVDAELHLYGAGRDSLYIEECSKKDKRIKFMGRVERKVLLEALKKAHLLVVNKPTDDDYSNYSFSSKILEYMASGTPVLTTRVGGMPVDYYDYFYFIEDESVEGIAESIYRVFSLTKNDLERKGLSAKQFAKDEKNYKFMTEKIIKFLQTINGSVK